MKNNDPTEDYLKVIDHFNTLTIDQKIAIFGNLPSKAREELINVVFRPTEIVRRISEEEMFFTIKDLGEENAEKLIALTTGHQLMYLLDIDLWIRNDLKITSISKWIQILTSVGDEKILQFVQVSEPELICSILNRLILVKLKNPDVDLTEQLDFLPAFTLDNSYFIDFKIPGIEEYIKEFLDCLFRFDSNYYMKLLQALSAGWLPEYEDRAYRWRSARLADHGFPDFEEALNIYSLFNPSLIQTSTKDSSSLDDTSDFDAHKLLKYPTVILSGKNSFELAVGCIEDPCLKDRITAELAHVANKVMVADGKDSGSINELKQSLQKTSGYINLAIEEILRREKVSTLDLISCNHMENLFRHGHTLITKLQYQARRYLDNYDGGIENLGLPLAPLLTGLLQKRPVFDPGGFNSITKREFEFIQDLEIIRNLINAVSDGDNWEVL